MKNLKSVLTIRKSLLLTLIVLVLSIVIVSVGTVSTISTQTDSTTTVYFDPPTITGTTIGEKFSVNLNIRDAPDTSSWMAGLLFNATLLECTGFFEGEFLSSHGPTQWVTGAINNTSGVITANGAFFLGYYKASGDGRLAYLNFTVKAAGVSDLHLRNVIVVDYYFHVVPTNMIDVYTVVVNATSHTVVTVSNSTGSETDYDSGFYDHAFNQSDQEVSFKVTCPYPSWSNVTIPKTLLPSPVSPYEWGVIIDDIATRKTITDNATHTSIYFTYSKGIHNVQITTRFTISTISITLNPTSIRLGSSVTISGAIDPAQESVNVTILYKLGGGAWTFLVNETTDSNGDYSHTWKPEKVGTYQVKANWKGTPTTLGDESEAQTLTVKEAEAGIPLEYVVGAVVGIIIIVGIVVYFVKIRKPEEEE